MKYLTYLCLILLALFSCNGRKTAQLRYISKLADSIPDSACVLLVQFESEESDLDRADRMHYIFTKTKIEDLLDKPFTADSAIKEVADYYSTHETANESMYAYYLLGRVYVQRGESPQALQAYYDALEKADTTRADFDYRILVKIYGQMADLFHLQNLPEDEIRALHEYCKYKKISGTNIDYVVAKGQYVAPYYMLGKKDTVLQIIKSTYDELRQLGDTTMAVQFHPTAIYIYTLRNQLDKAGRLIRSFEKESGAFDAEGNIETGREHYYATKGFYELAVNHLDSAEFLFRKVIGYGFRSDGYRGLMMLYRQKNNMDSVVHYSLLFEDAQDTLHNNMQIDAIHRMASLYNYSRSERKAGLEAQKARNATNGIITLLVFMALGGAVALQYYLSYRKKKMNEIKRLDSALYNAKCEYQYIQAELEALKNRDYEKLIAEKEQKGKELKLAIENLAGESGLSSDTNGLEEFAKCEIAVSFAARKDFCADNQIPTQKEWRTLESQFRKYMPMVHKTLVKEKKLSPLELHVCILLILDFRESSIVILTNSLAQTITKAKVRANLKIFGENSAQTLKANLLHFVQKY